MSNLRPSKRFEVWCKECFDAAAPEPSQQGELKHLRQRTCERVVVTEYGEAPCGAIIESLEDARFPLVKIKMPGETWKTPS